MLANNILVIVTLYKIITVIKFNVKIFCKQELNVTDKRNANKQAEDEV
jgi:hypothetical protein